MQQPEDWTEPGAWEVAPGIYRLPLPLPGDALKAVNVYAINTPDELVVIDSGWAMEESLAQLERSLGLIGRELSDISRFLVTHVHRDHYSQAVAVRARFGTHIALGIGDRATLEWGQAIGDGNPFDTHLVDLRKRGAAALADRIGSTEPIEMLEVSSFAFPDLWLTGRQRLSVAGRELSSIPTPGHTQGHVVFADEAAGLMFAGDHVLPHITPSIGFEPIMTEQPLGDFLASLAVVRQMPDMRLLPAHGPVTDSVHDRVDELVAHHGERLDECESAVVNGATTAAEVAAILGWTRRKRHFDELDLFNQMLAIFESSAHLQLLAAQGRVTSVDAGDDILRYIAS